MPTLETYTLNLSREEAEKLRWTLLKHDSAVAIEKVQREILRQLDEKINGDKFKGIQQKEL